MLFEIDFENLSTHKHNTGIIITDLNDLKINDTYGHRTGDEYIKKLLKFLKNMSKNTVYRFGGDEFIILFIMMPNSKSKLL